MLKGLRLILTFVIATCCCLASRGAATGDTISVRILFRQNLSTLDLQYMGNRLNLRHFADQLEQLEQNPHVSISSILIEASASPEGTYQNNRQLAIRRAERTRQLLKDMAPRLKSPILIRPKTIDWDELVRLVQADPNVPYRNEVLRVLRTSSEYDKKPNLQTLRDGKPWKYMYTHLFPEMRYGELLICDFRVNYATLDSLRTSGSLDPLCQVQILPTGIKELKDLKGAQIHGDLDDLNISNNPLSGKLPPLISSTATAQNSSYTPFYSLNTNMLHDLLLVPNIGAEVYEPNTRLALALNWWYSWWKNDSWKWYWRYYGGDLAMRWYFGSTAKEQPFAGHHIGIYGDFYTYDFELGGKGYIGGIPRGTLWDKGNIAYGIEYGYSLPVGRRVSIDFMIGLGYSGGEQRQYIPAPSGQGYVWERTIRRNFIGPTKAGVSLVWLLNTENHRFKKKGGAR